VTKKRADTPRERERYVIVSLPEAEQFLLSLHQQKDVADRVLIKLMKQLEYLERFGRYLERPHAAKLAGYEGLYELRVADESGWYRLFYGFGPADANGATQVALVHGVMKHEENPPLAEYVRAEARLREWKKSPGTPTR
jgi:phage-related protein